jgi:hypothetical protein
MAFVEHRGVNRDRRRILKALLMKASQYGGAFGSVWSSARAAAGLTDGTTSDETSKPFLR